jgi:flagellar hook-associated protein FlgK
MASTFFGLNIGKSGLYAYKSALDTTAHNITNTETEGYTRQVMGQQASKAIQVNSSYGMAGTGVTVTGVTQQRDDYYDVKYWNNNTIYGEYSGKSHYMTEIENYFNDISTDGFTTTYSKLNDSLQELQKNPSSLTVRTQVANYAKGLTEYFNSLSNNLKSIQEECNFEIKNQVDKINSKSQQIAALTQQINTLETNGGAANDLRDQRALLIDQLSEIANVSVTEHVVGAASAGVTSYVVKLNGAPLVDGNSYKALKVVPREKLDNQNDVEGLYDIAWENGLGFEERSPSLGGALQGLLDVRDGNNQYNFSGETSVNAGDSTVTVTDTNMNKTETMNLPSTGVLTIGNREYDYTGFEVTKDSDGKYVYTFELKDQVNVDAANEKASIGSSIDYKGVPYYLSQINEFARTYAKAFNDIHRTGVDLNGASGEDVFTATNKVSGRNYTFGPLKGSSDEEYYDYNTFNSQTGGYYEDIPENQPLYGSYYLMTAENFTVNKNLISSPAKFATGTKVTDGKENNDVVDKLLTMKDNKMLFEQGAPAGFYQTLVAEIGIDMDKTSTLSKNQTDILNTIKNQRLSESGVDADEEAMNLVRYQSAYNLSAKVVSTMNEIYDKLINEMGV